ncbi:MAG: ABC transporter substrate-binding protein [Parafilimonas terrae]|nr:ABC transporter substrate-binding protein [Parafilimonas terrae]
MNRRDFLASTTLLGGAAVLGTFSPLPLRAQTTPRKGGTLIWGHSETTQGLDIHTVGAAASLRVLQNIHCAIVTIDKSFNIVPSLAEKFDASPDLLTYTFHLRPGVKFHDGKAMTAADVKYSFDRCRDPKTGAVNFEVFNDVDAIETPDDKTVIVRMKRVNAPFLGRLAENGAGAIIPAGSGDTQGTTPIGAGPFKFARREFGHEIELLRFDDYWEGPAYLDRIIEREITEPTVRLTGLRTGELHVINDIPADRVAEIGKNPKLQTLSWFPLNFDFLNMNHEFEPFKDARVRQAIDLMIDKDQLLQGALWSQGKLTASPSFPTSGSYDGVLKSRAQDMDKAQALLAEAGYGPGKLKLTFKVTTNYPYHVEAAQIMTEWFRAGGVDMKIEQLTWADWLSQCWTNRDFQITMMNFFTLWEPDFLYYSLWNSKGGFNYRNIKDAEIDKLTQQARETVDPAVRSDLYKQVQQRIFDQTHDVVLWFRNGSMGAQTSVGGLDSVVNPNGSNLNFHKAWLNA